MKNDYLEYEENWRGKNHPTLTFFNKDAHLKDTSSSITIGMTNSRGIANEKKMKEGTTQRGKYLRP